jgi:hypothetical protein
MTGRGHGRLWSALVLALAAAVPLLVTDAAPAGVGASRAVAAVPSADPSAEPSPASAAPSLLSPAATPPPSPAPPERDLARAAVDAAQARAAGSTQLAVAVLDRRTGELAVNGRGDEPYYTASLSKLVVIVDVLDRRRLDGLTVTDADLALIERALGPSDDSAMSALWERFDGAGAPARVSARLGLEGTSAPRRTGQWGEVEVTAADYVKLWRYVLDEMPAADRDLLITDMEAAPPVATDGFDQAFGLLAPEVRGSGGPGAVAKQGWMCCFSGQYYLHSAGALGADRRFVMALLTRVPRSEGWPGARSELDGITAQAVAALE